MADAQALLTEYQVAHNEVVRLNRQLWTTAQILIPLSLAAVGMLLSLSTHSGETFTMIVILSLASSLVLWGWQSSAQRWLAYQNIALHRIKEIERELDLWCLRYEMHGASTSRGVDPHDQRNFHSEEEMTRLAKLPTHLLPTGKPTGVLVRNLSVLLVLTWVLLVLREAALVLRLL